MRYGFADCDLDISRHGLRRGGQDVHVEPQVFDLLALLARLAPALVSYDDMIAEIWDGRIVSDSTLSARINAARTAVGDTGKAQAIIRTVPRRGVQMVVEVTARGHTTDPAAEMPNAPVSQSIRFARAPDGARIAYASSGQGPPLLRGGHWMSHLEHDWNSPVWRPLLERLSARHRLVRYDPRGTGLSERRFAEATIETFAGDLGAVADAAGLGRFPIFAASQSVPISIAFAAAHPERVSRMVLLAGFSRGGLARGQAGMVDAMTQMIRSGWGEKDSAFVKAFSTLFLPAATPQELQSFVEMQQVSASPEVAVQLRASIDRIDVQDLLGKVEAPVLVLHASHDAIHPISEGQELAACLPNAEFRQIDSRNHVPVPSDPAWEVVMTETEAFLGRDAP